MTRADVPVWRMPFPTLPTISGRRPASRRCRRQWKRGLKTDTEARWARAVTHHVMTEHARLQTLTPEQAVVDGLD